MISETTYRVFFWETNAVMDWHTVLPLSDHYRPLRMVCEDVRHMDGYTVRRVDRLMEGGQWERGVRFVCQDPPCFTYSANLSQVPPHTTESLWP